MKQISVPYAIEKRVVDILIRNGNYWISTTEIANSLPDKREYKREYVYSVLHNFLNRQVSNIRPHTLITGDFVYMCKSHGKDFWCLRFNKIPEIESRWGLAITQRNCKKNHEQTAIRTVVTPIVNILKEPIINKAISTAFISITPIAREIYFGSLTAKSLYAVWNTLYDSLKTVELEDVERATYETTKEVGEDIWTDYQTDLVFESGNLKSSIKPEYQDMVRDVLHIAVKKITEGEISIVEQALQSL
jgi:hypothetical protein